MKVLVYLTIISGLVFGCAVKSKKSSKQTESPFTIDARYSAYQTAMGKGRGVIFRLSVQAASEIKFTIDSFYVNARPMPFVQLKNGNPTEIEANYMKAVPEPAYDPNGNSKPELDITDSILVNQQFYPSWILINYEGKIEKVMIDNYKKIN